MKFRRPVFLCLLFALVHPPSVGASELGEQQKAALLALQAAAQRKDCKAAFPLVEQQVSDPRFAQMPDPIKIFVNQIGLACAAEEKQTDLALRYAQAVTQVPGAGEAFWIARIGLAFQTKQNADAIVAVEGLARVKPEALSDITFASWAAIYRAIKAEKQDNLQRRLLAVLTSPGFVPAEAGASTDWFRMEYAGMLVEAGDSAHAATLVALIEKPSVLMLISVDPRLRLMMPANFDARAAVEKDLARMREIAAAHGNAIYPQLTVANNYLSLGKGEEALATLDAIDPASVGPNVYKDEADMLNWWWDSKAKANALLGRYDNAVKAYTQGKSIAEQGKPNISQTINLSMLQLLFGQPAQSLATLAPIAAGEVKGSPYGIMQFHGAHGCASFRAGKIEDARVDLAYMRTHFDDAPDSLTELQLCMGDIEGAAASIIKRLETPDHQAQALLDLSNYAPPPATLPKDPSAEALNALKTRSDVMAAVGRAGGTRDFNVFAQPK